MIYSFSLLIILLFVGFVTSYEDHINNKIRNQILLYGIISGLLVHAMFFNLFYFLNVFVNVLIAFIFGYILWYFNLWSSGDAKLFSVFAFLIPLEYYFIGRIPFFPSFTIFFNAFIPISLFLFFKGILSFNKIRKDFLKELNLKDIVINFLTISGFYWLFSLFIFNTELRWIIALIFVFVVKRYLEFAYIYFGLILFSLMFYFQVFDLNFFWISIVLFGIFYFLKMVILTLSNKVFAKRISVDKLEEGMILSHEIDNDKNIFCSGLSKEQISFLRKNRKFVYVEETIGFAKFLFLGCLMTIVFYGNFLLFILMII